MHVCVCEGGEGLGGLGYVCVRGEGLGGGGLGRLGYVCVRGEGGGG